MLRLAKLVKDLLHCLRLRWTLESSIPLWEHSYKLVIPVSRTHHSLRPSEELEKSTTSSSISCSINTVYNTLCTNKEQRPPRALGPPGLNRQTLAHALCSTSSPTPSWRRQRSRHLNNLVDNDFKDDASTRNSTLKNPPDLGRAGAKKTVDEALGKS